MTYTGAMVLPQNAIMMNNDEMRYVEGGKYIDYSYRKISLAIAGTICVASIATGIAGFVGFKGAAAIANATAILSGIGGLTAAVAGGSKKHGLRVHLKKRTRTIKGSKITQWEPYKITKY